MEDDFYVYVFGGGITGMIAEGITFPLDTIKVRVQIDQNLKSYQTFKKIIKQEGFSSLYKGFSIVAAASVIGVIFN